MVDYFHAVATSVLALSNARLEQALELKSVPTRRQVMAALVVARRG